MNEKFIQSICERHHLGKMISEPTFLKGGLMHKMVKVETTTGKYVIKLLNPHIMKRNTALENFKNADALEFKLEKANIYIIASFIYNESKLQCLEGQYYYVFSYYEGKVLQPQEVTLKHCEKIGEVLAKFHKIENSSQIYKKQSIHIDWKRYLEKLNISQPELYELLTKHLSTLIKLETEANQAMSKLPTSMAICHNDLDCKNVMWNGEDFRIIDLECLGYSSPVMELFECALCWAGFDVLNLDFSLFKAFIQAYIEAGGNVNTEDFNAVIDSNVGRLEWLEYNLKRSLGIECSQEEVLLGMDEFKKALAQMIYYDELKPKLKDLVSREE